MVWGTAIGPTAFAGVLAGGTFDFAIEFLTGPGAFGQGNRVNLLAEQGSTIYIRSLPEVYTFVSVTWAPVAFPGSLNASGFTRLLGAGPNAPDFSGAMATRFGFAGSNVVSGTLTNYYDNFSLTITPTASVPEPSTRALLGTGLVAHGVAARRRRTS